MSAAYIPQADSLRKIRAFVAYVADRGPSTTMEAGKAVGLSLRHAAYYRDGAECLGLLHPSGDELQITDAARRLLGTPEGSALEGRMFRRLVHTSRVLSRLAPGLLGEQPPSREIIAGAIAREGKLAPSVADRRAACLLRWRNQILEREHPQLALPF